MSTNLYSWTSAKGAALWVDLNFRSWLFGVYREGYPFRVGWYLHLGPLSVILTRGR